MKRRTVLLGGLVFAVIVLLALPVFSTLQAGYYGRYETLRPRMENWGSSTHARVSCVECHVNPGVTGFASFAVRSVPAFYSQLIEGPHAQNLLGKPDMAACQRCHTGYRQVSPDGDLLIPHRAHVEVLAVDCVVCHSDLVHSENSKGFNRPEMTLCLDCHDGVQASAECVDCHTRKHTPDTHAQKDWLVVHGTASKTQDCGECHEWTPDYCADCHSKRPASHTGNWKTAHAKRAKVEGDGCLVCHGGEKFCKECH